MLNRVWVKSIAGVLVVVGLVGVWRLRPGLDRPAQQAEALHIEAECDSAQRACRARGEDIELELRLGPPVLPMQDFEIQLRSMRGALAADAQVEVQFQMRAMDMGHNRYRLVADADGVWRGRAMLPVCSSGRSDWFAQLEISAGDRRWQAELPFTIMPHPMH